MDPCQPVGDYLDYINEVGRPSHCGWHRGSILDGIDGEKSQAVGAFIVLILGLQCGQLLQAPTVLTSLL